MSGRGGRATLADVAAHAGVSPSTVSRVVRNATPVSAELEQAVRDAIAVTGYMPNLAARQLVTTRSDTVGMIVAEDQRRVFGEPFFGALMHGVVETLAATALPRRRRRRPLGATTGCGSSTTSPAGTSTA